MVDGKKVVCDGMRKYVVPADSTYAVGELVGVNATYQFYCSNQSLIGSAKSGKELLELAGFNYDRLLQLHVTQTLLVWSRINAPETFTYFASGESKSGYIVLIPPRLGGARNSLPNAVPLWCTGDHFSSDKGKHDFLYKFYYPDIGFFTLASGDVS
jgi:hypothetical protein